MKKTALLIATVAAILFSGCDPKNSKEYIAAQHELDSLKAIVQTRDTEVKSLFDALTEIEDNLSEVSSKFQRVDQMKRGNNEANQDTRSKIKAQINDINEILSDNKRKLADLNQKLKKSNLKIDELNKYVLKLQERVNEQDAQIQTLLADVEQKKVTIQNLSNDVSQLTKQNEEKDNIITQKTLEVNTAYYVIGTKKELKDAKIVDKQGGFIGIGAQTHLRNDADNSRFTKVDITKATIIKITPTKKVKVVTSHSEESYELVKDANKKIEALKINNPQEFWKMSKYLVLLID